MNIAGIPVVFDPSLQPGTYIIRQGRRAQVCGEFPLFSDAVLFASIKREAGYLVEAVPRGAGGVVYLLGGAV